MSLLVPGLDVDIRQRLGFTLDMAERQMSGIRAARRDVFCVGIHSGTVGRGKEFRNGETCFFWRTFPTNYAVNS